LPLSTPPPPLLFFLCRYQHHHHHCYFFFAVINTTTTSTKISSLSSALFETCRFFPVAKFVIHTKKFNKMQQFTKFIIPCLREAQHVSGDTQPIIRSLKLH